MNQEKCEHFASIGEFYETHEHLTCLGCGFEWDEPLDDETLEQLNIAQERANELKQLEAE